MEAIEKEKEKKVHMVETREPPHLPSPLPVLPLGKPFLRQKTSKVWDYWEIPEEQELRVSLLYPLHRYKMVPCGAGLDTCNEVLFSVPSLT